MAISINDFGKAVVAAGLMSADEVKSLWDGLPPEARPKNAEAFCKLLGTRGKLTPYQATELAAGNGASLVLGDYVILAKIGAGGMGQVFKAEHRRMKRLVAIKLLPPALTKDEAAVKRFQREVEAAAKLSHPNIVTAHDAGMVRGAHYLVMEYIEGKDLSHLVKSRGPLPVADALNYITQAARGLAYAHSRGVVHRDIKPANLLLDGEGTVKILDMGLARFDEANSALVAAEEGLTQSGQVMGTVDYMAPEQAFDTRQADARADIYSLGCSLYRLLIGENVYSGDTLMQKLLAHREKPIPSLCEKRPDVPEALDAVFQKMMAKLPDDRYQPTSKLVADLEACAAGSTANLAAPPATSTFVPNIPSGRSHATAAEDGMTAALDNQLLRSLPDSRTPPRDDTFNSSINDRTQRGRKGQPTRVTGGKKPPWDNPVVLSAAGAGALLMVLLGIWVLVRDKDGQPVAKVEVPEGGSVELKTTPPKTTPSKAALAKVTPSKAIVTGNTEFVSLFNGKDLTGWTQVGEQGWRVQNGVVVGKTSGAPGWLMSDQEYTDVELELEYKLPQAGNSGVFLRAWPEGGATGAKFHEIQLLDDAPSQYANLATNTKNGSIFNQLERTLTPQAPAGVWNQLRIVNQGEQVQVTINGLRVLDGNLPAGKRSSGHIGLQLYFPGVPKTNVAQQAVEFRNVRVRDLTKSSRPSVGASASTGFVSLFNGKDLSGWRTHSEHSGNWRVESGVLVGSDEHTTYLFSNRNDYSNFHVRVETRIESGGSAGISCRSPFEGKSVGQNSRPRVLGYLAKINPDSPFDPRKTGSLYVMEPAGFRDGNVIGGSAVKPDEWFTLDVIVQGNHVVIQVNGQTATDFVDSRNLFSKGHIALQVMSGDKRAEFRKIEIKELGGAAK